MDNENPKNNINEQPQAIQETTSITHHSIEINGKGIKYIATAGTLLLKEADMESGEKQKAAIFYIAYTLEQDEANCNRPVTFSFNGGPGSSSVWMHLGLLGPRRVAAEEEGWPLPPPYTLVDNPFTLLSHSDLVFIDPVSTGYSRTVPREKPEQFHNIKKDIESVGEFIRLWITRNQRWNSAKFLIGESYGTTRAAGLADHLQTEYGMYLNGIILVSSILNFITAEFHPGNDLPYLLFLPTYSATAWYHRKLSPELQSNLETTIQTARDFASTDYALALLKGKRLSEAEQLEIAGRLASLTGLTPEYVLSSNLRINIHRFVKELLRENGKTIGRLDSRFTGFDRDSAGEYHESDPSYTAILGPFSSTLNDYVRRDLKYEVDMPYEILSNVHETWKYDTFMNQYVNTAENLRMAFQSNPALKVLVCNGYFDLATPFFATEYTLDHLELPGDLHSQITFKYYPSGHMMYIQLESLQKIATDLREFLEQAGN